MNDLFPALAAAARSLLSGRMMGLVLWPLVGAVVGWGILAWIFWGDWEHLFQWALATGPLHDWLGAATRSWIGSALSWLIMLPLLLVLVLATALTITSMVGMSAMVEEIAQRYFPALALRNGGTASGSIRNAVVAVLVYLCLTILSLPLWFLLPLGGLLLPLLINGWLNMRLFRYDALAEHASRQEYLALVREDGRQMLLLGVILTGIQLLMSYTILLLPIALLFFPVYSGLAFVYFTLARLQRLRITEPVPALTSR